MVKNITDKDLCPLCKINYKHHTAKRCRDCFYSNSVRSGAGRDSFHKEVNKNGFTRKKTT